jgi:hypothetical protein
MGDFKRPGPSPPLTCFARQSMYSKSNSYFAISGSPLQVSVVALTSLALIVSVGCSKEEAKTKGVDIANTSVKWLTGLDPKKDFGEMRQEFLGLKRTLEAHDYERLRQACLALDQKYKGRVLGWYATILLKEHTEGVESAQAEIQRLKSLPDLQSNERTAIAEVESYFLHKGKTSTVRLVLSAYAFYLESQRSHSSVPVQVLLELSASKEEKEEVRRLFEPEAESSKK